VELTTEWCPAITCTSSTTAPSQPTPTSSARGSATVATAQSFPTSPSTPRRPRRGAPVEVRVEGEQFSNGAEQQMIAVDESDGLGALTANDARELAVVLLDAAERLDGHRCPIARNADQLRGALAAYNTSDDDESHERTASLLAAAVTQLLR
jgi:hypothetical protein